MSPSFSHAWLTLEVSLIIAITKPLFAWDALEDSPSLQSVRATLEAIPDGPLLAPNGFFGHDH